LKGKSNFGYKFLFFIALVVAIMNAAARGHRPFFVYNSADPDSTATKDSLAKADSLHKLRFPIYDKTGDPVQDYNRPRSIDLNDPKNEKKGFEFDPDSNRYNYSDKLGGDFLRNPTYLTLDEYEKYRAQQDQDAYFQRRMDGLMLFNKQPELPQMYKEGLFDRIFGGNSIQVKPQGNVDVTFGGNWQNIKNPTLTQRAQKYGVFDFDMQMNINLLATVGDKLKLNISNNTKATFDYQNVQKLDYSGKEDEMLKKIEAGNVSFPLKSNLISGVQSLFGLKTQLQFGKLWVTAVLSQQKSQRKSLTIQGGAQSQQIAIKASNYEENKDFLLAQYFYNNYNYALKDFPKINSGINISKIEVWVTNKNGVVNGVRNVECFMDLGEANPHNASLANPNSGIRNGLPDNNSNYLYRELQQSPYARLQSSAINTLVGLHLKQQEDYEATTARQLTGSEYSYNAKLGYIMLNTQLNPEDVLGVAYRYTYKGKVYQVGEFAEDLPPDSTNSKVIFLKLMKGTSASPTLPVWNLMMKNVYALGGLGVSKDNFILNVLYQLPGGAEIRYLPEGPQKGVPLLTLENLDRLNAQGEAVPDGFFDFAEGITINTQQGKIIFPTLRPFGDDLGLTAFGPKDPSNRNMYTKYIYQILYDSTKTIAQQSQQTDRYVLKGSYKSSSSSDIFLGGFNIPPGSVSVSAGGTRLVENQDYTMDYGLGRIKILNTGILNSGVPINIQYEDNATFGFQQQNFMGARFDYYVNRNLTLGATVMRLNERPFTQQVSYGDDPIKNTVLGADANYQTEVPALTRALDKLPIYSTTAPSFLNSNVEVAALLPGHPKQIDALDPEGAVYIDNFEGTSSSYDLKFPSQAWALSSTPYGAVNKFNQVILPEAGKSDALDVGVNRAKLAWYTIEPTLVDPGTGAPSYVSKEVNQHYIRMVQQQDIFPAKNVAIGQNISSTFDLGFYPKDRGPYNFDATDIDNDGGLLFPERRWGGITRPLDNSDFEASNVEYIQFWLMNPFIGPGGVTNTSSPGGSLYFDLGDVSEDVLKDSRMFFENSIPSPFDRSKLDTTVFGFVPKFEQQITRAFDNDPNARALQDVGYDGLPDTSTVPGQIDERTQFSGFLTALRLKLGAANPAYTKEYNDPANDNYHFYRGTDYDAMNNGDGLGVLARYKRYNNPQGNSPITSPNAAFATSSTTLPESEDLNNDNTLNQSESYFQYRVDLDPKNMQVGSNYIISSQTSHITLPNGKQEDETWYQFKIPVLNYDHKVGGISDFRSIRFIRMFLNGWQDSVILRFGTLELGRNQWRTYHYSLEEPGEQVPQHNQGVTDFTVTSVSIEENGTRSPIPYVIPPGVNRQLTTAGAGNSQPIQLNEQSLSLKTCALQDGDARAVYKEINVDMRQFTYLRMFIHAESIVGAPPVKDADVSAFIRIGSDFSNNYYEYRMPLAVTPQTAGASDATLIWPASNEMDVVLQDLVNAKKARDKTGFPATSEYITKDSKGNEIIVVGNPNIGGAKNVMMGVLNPKKTNKTPGDDGLPKCSEVWFDELRMAGINDQAGYAAAGKVAIQLADLGNLNLSGSMHTPGYGNIDQKIDQRMQDKYYQYNTSTNLNFGKLMPHNWGVTFPVYLGYTQNVSTPKYNPYNEDVLLDDALNNSRNAYERDSLKKAAQDFTSIKSFNITNARIQGNPNAKPHARMPWSIKNFDFSYSYNDQLKHNPTIERDDLKTQRYGLGYTYGLKTKPFEPFKRAIRSKSKWLSLIRDFNITPLPSTFSHREDLTRINEETKIRDINDGSGYRTPPSFYKNFTWNRTYTLRWELMRSLSLDYSATNISRVDEPYGKINTKEKKDSLWRDIATFGHNTSYSQTFNSSYNMPLAKLPLTDWISLRLGYSANYSWTGAVPVAYTLGNTLGNTQTKTVTGELNMPQLYNKWRLLRGLNSKPVKKGANKPGENKEGGKNSVNAPGETKQNVKDLRKPAGKGADKEGLPVDKPGADNPDKKGGDNGGKPDSTKSNPKTPPEKNESSNPAKGNPGKSDLDPLLQNVNTANMTDNQIDSLLQVLKEKERDRIAAEKAKKKAARKAARKARRSKVPELTPAEAAVGHVFTMLNRVTLNYTETSGTILPGYMDSTRFMGVNNYSGAPGFDFVYGYQPDYAWLARQAAAGRLSRDSLFNAQFQQTFSRNISASATFQPQKDLRIELNMTQTFSKSHSELYADTTYTDTGTFRHFNPYENGSFNITYVTVKNMFKNTAVNSVTYNEFLSNRAIISRRLGASNPYTAGIPDPTNPGYTKGYGPYSQDVLIPSFIAAYSSKSAESSPLIDYNHSGIRDNPFHYFTPMPNWKVTYNGLSKLPLFQAIFSNFVVNHGYTGTMSMNGFSSNLLFNDLYGLGFPSFIDSNSHNYIPFFQVPNVTISQAFNPLIGFDMAFKNNLTARFDIRKSKMESLSLIDYQIGENTSTEYVVGLGFRKKGIKLPFKMFGVTKLKNELIAKLDVSLRDDKTSNTFLANNINVVSRGQKVIRISPTVDYSVNQKLTLHFFFDRQQSIPYVSNSYPTTTTRAGVTLRFIFAQ
jgi:cell surface protein SprA